jgi:GGDEF domain-containing protein
VAFTFSRRQRLPSTFEDPFTHPSGSPKLVPERFEALLDALLHDGDASSVCSEIGGVLASDGMSIQECFSALRQTFAVATGREPTFEACRALSSSWSEASLQFLHALSCEDPLTGLTSLAHLRSRLAEIYRELDRCGGSAVASHALVVVDVTVPGPVQPQITHHFDRVLRIAGVAECLRAVYSGGETLARLGQDRTVALVGRDERLGTSLAMLRLLLADWARGETAQPAFRVWVEQLPGDNDAAGRLLDELAR